MKAAETVAQSMSGRMARRFFEHRLALASLIVLGLLTLAALAAPLAELLLGVDADRANLFNRLAPPSLAHPFGTDELGRDVFTRLLHGGAGGCRCWSGCRRRCSLP